MAKLPNKWPDKEKELLVAALAAVMADIATTKIALASGKSEETNPLLGKQPSGATLDMAGGLSALGGMGLASMMPDRWRAPMLGGWAGLEAGLAMQNMMPGRRTFEESLMFPMALGGISALLSAAGGDTSNLRINLGKSPSITYTKKF